MMNEGTNANSGEAPVHDQLPSIEAVRIHAAAQLLAVDRAIAASPRNSSSKKHDIKPRNTSPKNSAPNRDKTTDEEEQVHDQLPSVEEIRANASVASSSPLRIRWGIVGCLMLLTIVLGAGIGLGVGLADKNRSSSSASVGGSTNFPSRSSAVKVWLMKEGLSTSDDLSDADSPQYKAAEWISDDDPLRVPIPEGEKESRTAFVERYALAVFFFATSGDEWAFNLGFVSGKLTCSWNRAIVSPGRNPGETQTFDVGAMCNTAAEVTSLNLPGNRLAGTIPDEIGYLTMLNFLGLETNKLTGDFPDSMSKLTLLDYFALQYNELSGEVPSYFGDMTNLRVLGLGNNFLQGTVPTSIARLTNLLTLGFDDNLLSGDLSFLQGLNKMERLYLEDNIFVHSLDSTVFSDMVNLEELDLSTNGINGSIPSYFFEYDKLKILDLHDNELTGSISPDIPVNEKLTFISVAENGLTGPIPSSIANCLNATHLDFSRNAFTGTFPEDLATMKELVYLFLASNAFKPEVIPPWMDQLTGLKDLSLRNTSRLGFIPEFLGTMTNLILLDLSFNALEFTIPSTLGKLKTLAFLFLNRNDLTGVVPKEVQELGTIEILLVDKNDLKGSVGSLCNNTVKIPRVLIADCDSFTPEVICPCCTLCCDDSRIDCNDNVYYGALDAIWENSYEREFYEFASDLIFDNVTRR